MYKRRRLAGWSVAGSFSIVVLVASCGARTGLPDGDDGIEDDGTSVSGSTSTSGERNCNFNCTVGHKCCLGSCDGPAVPTANDCCQCLPGEVNSTTCPDGECGD